MYMCCGFTVGLLGKSQWHNYYSVGFKLHVISFHVAISVLNLSEVLGEKFLCIFVCFFPLLTVGTCLTLLPPQCYNTLSVKIVFWLEPPNLLIND